MPERLTEQEMLRRVISSALSNVHTSQPGRVESYDRADQTATVRPEVAPGGEQQAEIQAVPVIWPRGGDGYLHFPLAEGDTGLIVTSEVDVGAWRRRGEAGAPAEAGRHALAFSVFLPGLIVRGAELDAGGAGRTILAGADVRVGAADADEKAIGGDAFESAHDTLMAALKVWIAAVSAQMTIAGGDIQVRSDNGSQQPAGLAQPNRIGVIQPMGPHAVRSMEYAEAHPPSPLDFLSDTATSDYFSYQTRPM